MKSRSKTYEIPPYAFSRTSCDLLPLESKHSLQHHILKNSKYTLLRQDDIVFINTNLNKLHLFHIVIMPFYLTNAFRPVSTPAMKT